VVGVGVDPREANDQEHVVYGSLRGRVVVFVVRRGCFVGGELEDDPPRQAFPDDEPSESLLVSLFVAPGGLEAVFRRNRYNEWVMCLKKTDGDVPACNPMRQLALSICPDAWVRTSVFQTHILADRKVGRRTR